jgi:hypothetical protein
MIVIDPNGKVLFHRKNGFQFLPTSVQDVLILNTHSTIDNDAGRYNLEVTFRLNNWEAVNAFQEELALCALSGQEAGTSSRK